MLFLRGYESGSCCCISKRSCLSRLRVDFASCRKQCRCISIGQFSCTWLWRQDSDSRTSWSRLCWPLVHLFRVVVALDELHQPSCCTAWRPLIIVAALLSALKLLNAAVSPSGKERSDRVSPDPIYRGSDGDLEVKSTTHQNPKTPLLGLLNDTLESSATLAPERDCPSSPSPCPTPPPSPPSTPPPSAPPAPALTPHLPLPAVCRAGEDGERREEERAHSSNPSADPYCRVMGLLGMGHRLFVPKLLAVRDGVGSCTTDRIKHAGFFGLKVGRLTDSIDG